LTDKTFIARRRRRLKHHCVGWLRRALFGGCLFSSALDRGELREAQLARAELAHDLGAAAARVVDPFALAAGTWLAPVGLGSLRVLDDAGLSSDSVGTCSGRSYGTTDVTSEHSVDSRKFCRRRVAGVRRRGAGYQIRTGDLQLGKLTLYR
jgi:hypothetical protein